ncbi:uncharacterized protein LOC114736227 [Neltuma alba]|uniref:uncharacterized protein LOC114736227 n=1 Tax=Neltuma alba TaxID=207710 RepID=UPI0010A53B8F|nr:uncharacterized protein LOC114736227 [Prosopis alba]XP_028779848.1 uncharacterized protein LOC114736227 [Prosopis alba]XP_028779849.1 uncharacterized protein LOC114736227 [Prosopis alba]XP_028779850.1 uncharacterized protein LOC114736227 [Prosopis alba]
MAAAEVRAVWQRTANRCFVQEDAKRAPKLACCQPSCASSKLADAEPANVADDSANAAVNVMPFNRKSSFSHQSPDSRWWLQMQTNYGHQKSTLHQQSSALDDEPEMLKTSDEDEICEDFSCFGDEEYDSFYHVDYDSRVDMMKKATKDEMLEGSGEKSQPFVQLMDMTGKHEAMEIDSVGCSVSKQMDEFNLDSSWTEGDKAEPWWQTTDRDELASFVLMRSLDNIENCDLPPPRRKYVRRHPCDSIGDEKTRTSCVNWETKSCGLSNLTTHAQESLDSRLVHGKQGASADEKFSRCASENPSSYTTVHKDTTEEQQAFEGDPGKAQLMEALCHSQTRAREAEGAAKQAYAEKEQVVRLIFKQASQLFAYKQWFRLLQLETLLAQIKNKDQPLSTLLPAALPWITCEGRKLRKRRQKLLKTKRQRPTSESVTTYAVAFALGLSIVGAGLLLGCCAGWMLPHL